MFKWTSGQQIQNAQFYKIQRDIKILTHEAFYPNLLIFDNRFNKYITSTAKMLDSCISNLIAQNRRSDEQSKLPRNVPYGTNLEIYSNFICTLLEVKIFNKNSKKEFFYIFFSKISQECDRLNFHKSTKYLAKNYFDRYLALKQTFPVENFDLLLVCTLRIAVKFNESQQLSESYTLDICYLQCQARYQPEQFIAMESQILFSLNFQIKRTTPYDFILPTLRLTNVKKSKVLQAELVIDFVLSLSSLSYLNAEQIFFSSLMFSLSGDTNNYTLELVKCLTDKWQKCLQIAKIIKREFKKLDQGNLVNESQ